MFSLVHCSTRLINRFELETNKTDDLIFEFVPRTNLTRIEPVHIIHSVDSILVHGEKY